MPGQNAIVIKVSEDDRLLLMRELTNYAFNQSALAETEEVNYRQGYLDRAAQASNAAFFLETKTAGDIEFSAEQRSSMVGALYNRIIKVREAAHRAEVTNEKGAMSNWRDLQKRLEGLYGALSS